MGGKRTSSRITTYLPAETVEKIENWAKSENRTVSNLTATILINALENKEAEQQNQEKQG